MIKMRNYMKVLLASMTMTLLGLFVLSHIDLKLNHSNSRSEQTEENVQYANTPLVQPSIQVSSQEQYVQRETVPSNSREILPTNPEPSIQTSYKADVSDWFAAAWGRSLSVRQGDRVVDDRPLFPACERKPNKEDKYSFIEPKYYLPSSKNPCWYEDPARKRGFRCLPYFYVAGVAKCGTTDLYRRLRMHPDIMTGTKKEYHFWDRERFGNVDTTDTGEILKVNRKPVSFRQYLDDITGEELNLLQRDVEGYGESIKLFGDGSPSYLWDVLNWQLLDGNQGCREPRVVISQHIRHIYPASKMILIFRHPTPRLYSRFLSRIWRTSWLKGSNSKTFHNYVVNAVKLYRECFERYSVRQCVYNYTIFDNAVVRLVEGMYPIFMTDWLRIWPRDQLLILRSEDYSLNMTGTLETAFNFLGVAKLSGAAYDEVMNQKLANVGTEYETIGPMKPETVAILDEFYQPFVEKFAELLQDRRFLWLDTYPPKS